MKIRFQLHVMGGFALLAAFAMSLVASPTKNLAHAYTPMTEEQLLTHVGGASFYCVDESVSEDKNYCYIPKVECGDYQDWTDVNGLPVPLGCKEDAKWADYNAPKMGDKVCDGGSLYWVTVDDCIGENDENPKAGKCKSKLLSCEKDPDIEFNSAVGNFTEMEPGTEVSCPE